MINKAKIVVNQKSTTNYNCKRERGRKVRDRQKERNKMKDLGEVNIQFLLLFVVGKFSCFKNEVYRRARDRQKERETEIVENQQS